MMSVRREMKWISDMSDQHKYEMTISRLTVDKLGVKLYDRVAAVIAELIANSYDADASDVTVRAPMDTMLANRSRKVLTDQGYEIVLEDDGCGMTSEEVNSFYLKVGTERRKDPRRGDTSNRYGRKVMGRKGVGKLAPFGVCQKIEVLTSGGDLKRGLWRERGGRPWLRDIPPLARPCRDLDGHR